MNITVRAVVAGLFFLFVLLSGIWLSRKGRPLNVGISTVHKLISLAAGTAPPSGFEVEPGTAVQIATGGVIPRLPDAVESIDVILPE